MQFSFTFWLLIIVLFMIAAAILIPRFGGGYGNRLNAAHLDIRGGIKTALDRYKFDNDFFPGSLTNLIQASSGAKHWSGPYLDQFPIDPWGNNYVYEFPGKHNPSSYDLMSVGPDGKKGTEDDIGNW